MSSKSISNVQTMITKGPLIVKGYFFQKFFEPRFYWFQIAILFCISRGYSDYLFAWIL